MVAIGTSPGRLEGWAAAAPSRLEARAPGSGPLRSEAPGAARGIGVRVVLRLVPGEQQVVEDRRGKPGFEHALVESLQREVAMEGVAAPEEGNLGGIGTRLE